MGYTKLQEYALSVMNYGYNVYLTGDAGTGKSYIVNEYIEQQEAKGKNVMKLAPTGVAAAKINGVTIHRQFKVPVGPVVRDIEERCSFDDTLVETDIIVIDEISMCRIDLFDLVVSQVLTANNNRRGRLLPLIQLIIVGDFFQLPPIMKPSEKGVLDKHYGFDTGVGFAFNSRLWKLMEFKNVILTEIIRQQDKTFLSELNKVRTGNKTSLQYFMDNASKNEFPDAITICGRTEEVLEINNEKLSKIPSQAYDFIAELDGEVNYNETIAEYNLTLKLGARVMTLVNKHEDGYMNGSFGTVNGMYSDCICVLLDDGTQVYVKKYTWEIYRYELDSDTKLIKSVVGSFTQFPLKLAYAITIHKSQGQTYDYVNLYPYSWDCGQLYTALSRVKDIKHMYLKYDINMKDVVVSLNVIDFNNKTVQTANKQVEPPKQQVRSRGEFSADMDKITSLISKK